MAITSVAATTGCSSIAAISSTKIPAAISSIVLIVELLNILTYCSALIVERHLYDY